MSGGGETSSTTATMKKLVDGGLVTSMDLIHGGFCEAAAAVMVTDTGARPMAKQLSTKRSADAGDTNTDHGAGTVQTIQNVSDGDQVRFRRRHDEDPAHQPAKREHDVDEDDDNDPTTRSAGQAFKEFATSLAEELSSIRMLDQLAAGGADRGKVGEDAEIDGSDRESDVTNDDVTELDMASEVLRGCGLLCGVTSGADGHSDADGPCSPDGQLREAYGFGGRIEPDTPM